MAVLSLRPVRRQPRRLPCPPKPPSATPCCASCFSPPPLPAQQPVQIRIAGGNTIRGTHHFSDKLGNQWDINTYYGTIQQGTNYVYSNANYLYVSGSNFRSNNGQGQLNKAGDEIQVGPWSTQGLTVYRRIKIFPKDGIARWLDIYQNNGSKAITVEPMVRTQVNYGIRSTKSSSGKGDLQREEGLRVPHRLRRREQHTDDAARAGPAPAASTRPRVEIQGNQIQTHYRVKVPPKETVIVAYFEGQNRNASKLDQLMKPLPRRAVLRGSAGRTPQQDHQLAFGGVGLRDQPRAAGQRRSRPASEQRPPVRGHPQREVHADDDVRHGRNWPPTASSAWCPSRTAGGPSGSS